MVKPKLLLLFTLIFSSIAGKSQCGGYSISKSSPNYCVPAAVSLTVNGLSGGEQIAWHIDTLSSYGNSSWSRVFNQPGWKSVKLEITTNSGQKCIIDSLNFFQVFELPQPQFSANTTTICNGPNEITFTNTTPNTTAVLWNIDGTSYAQPANKINHKFSSIGAKTITIFATNQYGCRANKSFVDTIHIFEKPEYVFDADLTNNCIPQTPQIAIKKNTINPNDIFNSQWACPGSNTPSVNGTQPPNIIYSQAGLYTITYEVFMKNGCNYSYNQSNPILLGKTFDLSLKKIPTKLCTKEDFILETKSNNIEGQTTWIFEGGNANIGVHNENNIRQLRFLDTGWVSLKIENDFNGCKSTFETKNFVFVNGVSANFTSSNNYHCEVPHQINLTQNSKKLTAQNITHIWSLLENGIQRQFKFGDQINFSANELNKTYDVRLIANGDNGCNDTIIKNNFIVLAPLKVSMNVSPSISCTGQELKFNNTTKRSSYVDEDIFIWRIYEKNASTPLFTSYSRDTLFAFSNIGLYDVELIGKNGKGCYDSIRFKDAVKIVNPILDVTYSDTAICKVNSFLLEGKSTPTEAEFTYEAIFENMKNGKKFNFTGKNISANINESGVYMMHFIHKIANGCSDTFKRKMSVNAIEATLILDTFDGCSPLTIKPKLTIDENFQNGPQINSSISYLWNSNDIQQTIQSQGTIDPTITLNTNGQFFISVDLENETGCKTTLKSNNINIGVKAQYDWTPKKSTYCIGEKINIVDQSLHKPNSWKWEFSDETAITILSQSQKELAIQIKDSFPFSLKLSVMRMGLCADSFSRNFTTQLVNANFTIDDSSLYCAPVEAKFNSISINADSLFWNMGDGNIYSGTLKSIEHTYFNNTGKEKGLDIKLKVKSINGCEDSIEKKSAIFIDGPIPKFTVDFYEGCEPLKVQFTNLSQNANAYFFYDGLRKEASGTVPSNLDYPAIDDKKTTIFKPELLVYDSGGCSAKFSLDKDIEVHKNPVIKLSNKYQISGCAPFNFQLSADVSFGEIDFWKMGTKQNNSPIFDTTISLGGHFMAYLFAKNEFGCRQNDSLSIRIIDPPNLSIQIDSINCDFSAASIKLNIANTDTPYLSLNWDMSQLDSVNFLSPYLFNTYLSSAGQKTVGLIYSYKEVCNDVLFGQFRVYDINDVDLAEIQTITFEENYQLKVGLKPTTMERFSAFQIYRSDGDTFSVTDKNNQFLIQNFSNKPLNSLCYTTTIKDICGYESAPSKPHCFMTTNLNKHQPFSLRLTWAPYVGFDPVQGYEIFRKTEQSSAIKIATTNTNVFEYIDSNLCDSTYTYQIKAITNQQNIFSNSWFESETPEYQYFSESSDISFASVINNTQIRIEWPASKHHRHHAFELEKTLSYPNFIAKSITLNEPFYIDNDVDNQNQSVAYRVFDVDVCGYRNPEGRIGKTILLDGNYNDIAYLNWTPYEEWQLGVNNYQIQMLQNGDWKEIQNVSGSTLNARDEKFRGNLNGSYCYRIMATNETGDSSFSNELCLIGNSKIIFPTAFSPNGDALNETFKPYVQFIKSNDHEKIPISYEFRIYNRWGALIFETQNTEIGWDGNTNGILSPEGVYIYTVKAVKSDGNLITQKGSVTLVR